MAAVSTPATTAAATSAPTRVRAAPAAPDGGRRRFADCLDSRDPATEASATHEPARSDAADSKSGEAEPKQRKSDDSAPEAGDAGLLAMLLQGLGVRRLESRGDAADADGGDAATPASTATTGMALSGAATARPGFADAAEESAGVIPPLAASTTNEAAGLAAAVAGAEVIAAKAGATASDDEPAPDAAAGLLAQLNAMTNAPAAPAATTAAHSLQAASTPGALAEPLAERIVWMSDAARAHGGNGNVSEARIQLHPAEWGSLQIRIALNPDGSTRVSFDVDTPQARAAIEQSLPQLRELLAASTPVGNAAAGSAAQFELSGGLSQQARHGARPSPPASKDREAPEEIESTPVVVPGWRRRGLVHEVA